MVTDNMETKMVEKSKNENKMILLFSKNLEFI
jgi:hypothetical protein